MSCWVVPIVAAEYWGVTLDVVWRRIYEGLIAHKSEEGFIFVDVDSGNESRTLKRERAPVTFVGRDETNELAPEEEQALNEEQRRVPRLDEEESATFGRLSWQEVRQRVSRTRKPPLRLVV